MSQGTIIGIYAGGGRIGSGLLRKYFRASEVSDNIRVSAVVRGTPEKYIHTTIASSVYGMDNRWITGYSYNAGTKVLSVTNSAGMTREVQFIQHSGAAEDIDWGNKADENLIVIDASGNVKTNLVQKHFDAGADRVMVTAPLKGEGAATYPHIVFGLNERAALLNRLISWASCTTNGAMMAWAALLMNMLIQKIIAGDLLTIHAATNSQNLLDCSGGSAKKMCSLDSILPATTGYSEAAGVAMFWASQFDPSLHASLFDDVGAAAMRVPTSTTSLIRTNTVLQTDTPLSARNLNAMFLKAALSGPLAGIFGFTMEPVITTRHLIAEERTSIIHGPSTTVTDIGEGKFNVTWQTFYDNESGYVAQGWAILDHVLRSLGWGELSTERLTNWYSLFTHFNPNLNLKLESLDAKDIYTPSAGDNETQVFDFRALQAQQEAAMEARKPMIRVLERPTRIVAPGKEDFAWAGWFDFEMQAA